MLNAKAAAPQPLAHDDRRAAPRTSVLRDGQAFRADGLAAAVVIVDVSSGGARLRARGGQTLPDAFVLADPHAFVAHRCTVAWRRETEVGVRFTSTQSLRGVVPGALQPAKAYCQRARGLR